VNCINKFVFNILNDNIALKGFDTLKLHEHNSALLKLFDKRVSLSGKKRVIVQLGGFILPLMAAVLRALASIITAK